MKLGRRSLKTIWNLIQTTIVRNLKGTWKPSIIPYKFASYLYLYRGEPRGRLYPPVAGQGPGPKPGRPYQPKWYVDSHLNYVYFLNTKICQLVRNQHAGLLSCRLVLQRLLDSWKSSQSRTTFHWSSVSDLPSNMRSAAIKKTVFEVQDHTAVSNKGRRKSESSVFSSVLTHLDWLLIKVAYIKPRPILST